MLSLALRPVHNPDMLCPSQIPVMYGGKRETHFNSRSLSFRTAAEINCQDLVLELQCSVASDLMESSASQS